ncbi:MAG TPA: hypothetical protein VD971_02355 [Phycisphaerales bacterium]|nr:hypothetical protein [Phycisphaerales bacterium]
MSRSNPRADGKSRPAEMRRNETNRNPAGTQSERFAPADAPGKSSAKSRSTKSGAERSTSSTSARGGAGAPSGASSHNDADRHVPRDDKPM